MLLHLLASAKRGKAPRTSVCDMEKGCVSFALQNVLFLPFLVIVHSSLKKSDSEFLSLENKNQNNQRRVEVL